MEGREEEEILLAVGCKEVSESEDTMARDSTGLKST